MEGRHRDDTVEDCMQEEGSGGSSVQGILAPNEQTPPNPVNKMHVDIPFSKTIHISSKSDIFRGKASSYAGFIVYSRDGKSRWETANGTRCESGYLVIMETESEKIKMLRQQTGNQGEIHYAIYRSAFGEQCAAENLDAEGFFVINGAFEKHPAVFRQVEEGFHGNKRHMRAMLASCIDKVVQYWMNAGEHFYLRCRDFVVEDLIGGACIVTAPVAPVVPSLKSLAAGRAIEVMAEHLNECKM